jgi:VIT1/CCC1 family predicted Fe2+/Mn2+ transporter
MHEEHQKLNEHPHIEKHFGAGPRVRDAILGMSDGLTVPFALAAGLTGAVDSSTIIIAAGLAEIAAGSVSMGLGGYLAAQNEAEHYAHELKHERYEIEHMPDHEREEVIEIFEEYGLTKADLGPVLRHFEEHPDDWVNFMMKHELGLDKPDERAGIRSALTIAGAYVVGGIIPLSPYFFTDDLTTALLFSTAFTAIALCVFGWFKSRLIGSSPLKGAVRTLAIGGAAAAVAYGLARLLS